MVDDIYEGMYIPKGATIIVNTTFVDFEFLAIPGVG